MKTLKLEKLNKKQLLKVNGGRYGGKQCINAIGHGIGGGALAGAAGGGIAGGLGAALGALVGAHIGAIAGSAVCIGGLIGNGRK